MAEWINLFLIAGAAVLLLPVAVFCVECLAALLPGRRQARGTNGAAEPPRASTRGHGSGPGAAGVIRRERATGATRATYGRAASASSSSPGTRTAARLSQRDTACGVHPRARNDSR